MLFLLLQITIASPEQIQNVGLSNPWTEFMKILPSEVPVPTMWSEEERVMLVGTSLEVCLGTMIPIVGSMTFVESYCYDRANIL